MVSIFIGVCVRNGAFEMWQMLLSTTIRFLIFFKLVEIFADTFLSADDTSLVFLPIKVLK